MRYRLRTLLILTLIAGLLFARIAYLKQKARAHRKVVANLVANLAVVERDPPEYIQAAVQFLASGGSTVKSAVVRTSPRITVLENGIGNGVVIQHGPSAAEWQRAAVHEVIADRYDRAVYRSWTLVSESAP
jgi:hypothetical protein